MTTKQIPLKKRDGPQKNNPTGFIGVTLNPRENRGGEYVAHIRAKGHQIFLGFFDALQEAVTARNKAVIKYRDREFAVLSGAPA